jgi:type I restriction enzyme R subunit
MIGFHRNAACCTGSPVGQTPSWQQPRQPNLSYFAFTATPKFKTKALFDEPGDDGKSPYHLYGMRQAIQEKFILDVLANYTA